MTQNATITVTNYVSYHGLMQMDDDDDGLTRLDCRVTSETG